MRVDEVRLGSLRWVTCPLLVLGVLFIYAQFEHAQRVATSPWLVVLSGCALAAAIFALVKQVAGLLRHWHLARADAAGVHCVAGWIRRETIEVVEMGVDRCAIQTAAGEVTIDVAMTTRHQMREFRGGLIALGYPVASPWQYRRWFPHPRL